MSLANALANVANALANVANASAQSTEQLALLLVSEIRDPGGLRTKTLPVCRP